MLLTLFFGLEFFVRKGAQAKSLKPNRSDQNTTILIGASYPIAILLLPILNYFSIGKFPDARLVGAIGIGFMILGLAIRLWAMQTLGQFYTRTLMTSEEQGIIQSGPYRIISIPVTLGHSSYGSAFQPQRLTG